MKHLLIVLMCILLILSISVCAFAADTNADTDMRQRISDAWAAQKGSNLNWDGQALYYGIVGDCGIFLLNGPIAEESAIEVAGYSFLHSGSFQIYAFDGEDFFTLKEAYGSGLLTASDIGDINRMHNKTPNTGDSVAAVACVMVLSLAAATILVSCRKRFAD